MITDRLKLELELLRSRYPNLEFREQGQWVRLPEYRLPRGWSSESRDVAFQIPIGFPGTPPYGIYVPAGLRFEGQVPGNYAEPASVEPPFAGTWGCFSWAPADGEWRVASEPTKGSNLLNWAL